MMVKGYYDTPSTLGYQPTSHSVTSSSDLGLAKNLISGRFLGAPSCKKWLSSNYLRLYGLLQLLLLALFIYWSELGGFKCLH